MGERAPQASTATSPHQQPASPLPPPPPPSADPPPAPPPPVAPGSDAPTATPGGETSSAEPAHCRLCDSVLEAEGDRCPSCGLWMGGHGNPVARTTLYWVVGSFAMLYGLALLVIAVAR